MSAIRNGTIVVGAAMLIGGIVTFTAQSPSIQMLSATLVNLTSCVQQVTLQGFYLTNIGSTNCAPIVMPSPGGNISFSVISYSGKVEQVAWTNQTASVLQWSSNLFNWSDIPIVYTSNGERRVWYDDMTNNVRFFRTRSVQ